MPDDDERPRREKMARDRLAFEMGECRYEDFTQPPYHRLKIMRPRQSAGLYFELLCPFPQDDGEHLDLHYCTMIDCWPTVRHRTEGAMIEMGWRAIGMCFVCFVGAVTGIDHLLDVGLRIPTWAKKQNVIDVRLESYGEGDDFELWLAPVDPRLAALV